MEKINDILGYDNLKIIQDDNMFSFSLDSVMIANFVNFRFTDKKVCDLGTGNAVIPLILCRRNDNIFVDGIEIQHKVSTLAKKNVCLNKLNNRINIINIDMKKFSSEKNNNTYDVIVSNPPFFKYKKDKTLLKETQEKSIARHEIAITLEEVIFNASKLLKHGGNFFIVYRTERFVELLELLRKYKLEPKIIQFVHDRVNKDSTLVLVQSQKCANSGIIVKNPFILYDKENKITNNYESFLREVNKNETI